MSWHFLGVAGSIWLAFIVGVCVGGFLARRFQPERVFLQAGDQFYELTPEGRRTLRRRKAPAPAEARAGAREVVNDR